MNINYGEISVRIEAAARSAFRKVISENPNKVFCGVALYSDPAGITVCPAMNSVDNFNDMVSSDPDDRAYYRWSVGEWDHEFDGADFFDDLSKYLASLEASLESEESKKKFSGKIYEICVSVIEKLKSENFFDSLAPSVVFVFSVSDSMDGREVEWIARLNDKSSALEFKKWFSSL